MPVDRIMQLLEDGKWHPLREILDHAHLPQSTIKTLINFLHEYDLIHLNKGVHHVKINPRTLPLLKRIRQAEQGASVS